MRIEGLSITNIFKAVTPMLPDVRRLRKTLTLYTEKERKETQIGLVSAFSFFLTVALVDICLLQIIFYSKQTSIF